MDDRKTEQFVDIDKELQQGLQHHQSGQLQMAEAAYRKILAINPDHPDALHLLGVLAHQVGRHEIAIELINKAIHFNPHIPYYYNNIGAALMAQGKFEEAAASYQKAIQIKPDYAEAYYNLGVALKDQGRLEETVSAYQRAIQIKPDYAEAYYNLGGTYQTLGRIEAAISAYQKALQVQPDYPEVYNNLGNALREQGKIDEALSCYQEVIRLKPDYAPVYNNEGNIFLQEHGRVREAISAYQKAVQLKPDYMEAHSNYLMAIHYDKQFTKKTILQETLDWSRRHSPPMRFDRRLNNEADPGRRIKIGYVSGDLRRHPIGYFMETVLAHHHRGEVEVFCYYNHHTSDDITQKLQSFPLFWRKIAGKSDEEVEGMIIQDGIDILVDLSGHSPENRLLLFARRAAPIQATWMGYFDTTGIQAMDYIIADRHVIPEADERFYVEKVVRLPGCYLCYTPPSGVPEVSESPFLSSGYVTFGCFNNIAKANPRVVATWSRILGALPGSRLCLKTLGLRSANVRDDYIRMFSANGIDKERIDLLERSPLHEYFAYYGNIDIVLDTFPFTGNTTTFDALWMGVPVPTLVHDTFVGRFGFSILSTLGLTDLIAFTEDDYVEIVLRLARDTERLSALRQNLRSKMSASPLCDGEGFAIELERIYRSMWKSWCEKQASR